MLFETNKDKGRAGLAIGIAYFGTHGYTISVPLNDTQWYDFIAERNGIFYTVQCKATASKDNAIDLRSTGGTKGKMYDNVLNHPQLDFLFCLDKELNMYVIPMQDLLKSGNLGRVTLRKGINKNANKNCFDTSKYLVTF